MTAGLKAVELPDWVVCPLCRGTFEETNVSLDERSDVECSACKAKFVVKSSIPILLDDEGVKLFAHEESHDTTDSYQQARHASSVNIQYYDYWCNDLLSRLPQRPFRRVVELMAGGAEMARRARDLPKPIVAIDLSHKLLEMNRAALVPDVIPVCASATALPFADASVDLFIIQGGLHHVRRFVDKVLREIARCLSDGGVVLASEPRNDNLLNRAVRRAFYRLHPIPDAEEEDGFTRNQLETLMRAADLEVKVYDPFAYLGYVLIGNTDLVPFLFGMKPSAISSLLVGFDATMAKTPILRRLGWASQIVASRVAR
jgi:ubiquinone/menaquinone biosynthesis C-methylase UbiE